MASESRDTELQTVIIYSLLANLVFYAYPERWMAADFHYEPVEKARERLDSVIDRMDRSKFSPSQIAQLETDYRRVIEFSETYKKTSPEEKPAFAREHRELLTYLNNTFTEATKKL